MKQSYAIDKSKFLPEYKEIIKISPQTLIDYQPKISQTHLPSLRNIHCQ